MKKLKNLAFAFLLVFLSFGAMKVNAATIDIDDIDAYLDHVNIQEDTTLRLTKDVSLEGLASNYNEDLIYVGADLTIDLFGQTLTLPNQSIKLAYSGNHTVRIIDSSISKTGMIKRESDKSGISLIEGTSNVTLSLIIDGIKYKNTSTVEGDTEINNEVLDGSDVNVLIKNSTFEIRDTLYRGNDFYYENSDLVFEIENSTFKVNDDNNDLYITSSSSSTLKFKDVIDTSKSVVYGDDVLLNNNQELNSIGYKKIEIKESHQRFEIVAPTFNSEVYNAYSGITAKPISIKAVGVDRTIQNVTVDANDKFLVEGTGALVNAGDTNTGFTIKPKDGLSAGTHTATIEVIDTNNNRYTTTVTFVVNKAQLTKPSLTGYTPFTYDSNPKSVTVTGYDATKMSETGNRTGTDANDYSVTYSLLDAAKVNYEWTDGTNTDVTLNWKINKANLDLGLTYADWTYGGTDLGPQLTGVVGGGTVNYYYVGIEGTSYNYNAAPTNAGKYRVTAEVSESANYNAATKSAEYVINKKEIGISSESLDHKVFDDSTTINPSLIHVTLNDSNATFNVTGTSASKYVGTDIETTLVVTLTDEAYKNYTFASNSQTKTITYISHNITPVIRDFGNTTSSSSKLPLSRGNSVDLKTLITPSDVDFTKVTFAIASGQTGTTLSGSTLSVAPDGALGTVEVTATYAGIDENNDGTDEYGELTTTIYIDVVNKTVITIDGITFSDKTYDGVRISYEGELTASHSYNAASLICKYTGSNGYNDEEPPFQAGTYTYTCSVPNDDPNYTGSQSWTFTISKADPDYTTPTGLVAVVGVQLHNISLPTGFSWESANTTLTAGTHTYVVTYTPSDTTNYNIVNGIDVSVYVKNKFNLITNVNSGIGGTISDYKAGVVEGNKETVTFTPETGYRVAKVLVNSDEIAVSNNKLELTMDKNYTVEVFYEKIPYTLEVKTNENATITPTGTETVEHGDSKDIIVKANHGYKLISVKVNDVEKITDMSGDTLTLSSITENTTVKVEVAKITYNVVDGKNQNLDLKNGITSFVVKADGEYSDFSNLLIDDEEVSGTLYDVTEGSTIVTFNEDGIEFLKGLNKGQHTLTFVYEDGGVATTNFTITDSTKTNNPQTGDNVTLFIALGLISLIGLGSTVFVLKRKKTTA